MKSSMVPAASCDAVAPAVGLVAATWTVEALYRQHRLDVARWAARLGGPSIETADVVQEVFLAVGRKLPAFEPRARITTWLYRITENTVRYQRRKLRWRRFLAGGADEVAGELPDEAASALDGLERREGRAQLYRVLDRLGERQRTILILFEMEGLSGEEIAERLDMKVGTVWVALHRARAKFLAALRELEAADA
ncbi:MAG: RNA polymerase sigma factor [Myxococcales bacterium]